MSADVVNLRLVRKAKARTGRADAAAENRARYGRTLADRQGQAESEAKAARHLDGHHLGPSAPKNGP